MQRVCGRSYLPAPLRYFPFISDATLSTLSPADPRRRAVDVHLRRAPPARRSRSSHRRLDPIAPLWHRRGHHRPWDEPAGWSGRGPDSASNFADGRVSTTHATIAAEGEAFVLHDAGSKNGIVVNGARVTRHLLRDGDLIECGRTFFRYRAARARPVSEPLDPESAQGAATAAGLFTFHEPLAASCAPPRSGALHAAGADHRRERDRQGADCARDPRPSQRRGPFVGVNCGALPENLVEAELFGARRGAFTGATEERAGLVRFSHEGTFSSTRSASCRCARSRRCCDVLQEHEVLAIGATRPVPVDLRVVTATHRDLDALVQANQFRPDLLARIVGVIIAAAAACANASTISGFCSLRCCTSRRADRPAPTSASPRCACSFATVALNVRELEHYVARRPGAVAPESTSSICRAAVQPPLPVRRDAAADAGRRTLDAGATGAPGRGPGALDRASRQHLAGRTRDGQGSRSDPTVDQDVRDQRR